MVSAQMGGDGKTAIDAAAKLDAAVPAELVEAVPDPAAGQGGAVHDARAVQPIRTRSSRCRRRPSELVLVRAMYHYARAVAFARARTTAAARSGRSTRSPRIERKADFKPFEPWGVPAKEIVRDRAAWSPTGRLADASGDLDAAAKAYEEAIAIEDALAYMEPPYWYYPVRQSLGSVRLRQGRLDDAEQAFRDSLVRVRNNGWALAGLAEVERREGRRQGASARRARRTARLVRAGGRAGSGAALSGAVFARARSPRRFSRRRR